MNVKRYTLHHTYETFESVFTIVKHNNLNFLLGSIYHVPINVTFQNFMNEFTDLLMLLAYEQRPVILAVDFNVKINLPHSSDTSSFSTLISEFDFSPIFPSTATHRLGNVLDFAIVSSSLSTSVRSISLDSSIKISDHYPISLSLFNSSAVSRLPSLPRTRRFLNKLDDTAFSSHLSESLTSLESASATNLNDYLSDFNAAIMETLDHFAPSQSVTSNNDNNPRWMDREYIEARSLRQRYEKQGNKAAAYNRQNIVCSRLVKQNVQPTTPPLL